MLRSTFLGFRTATSALKVNQNIMDVVGQNMSNINTKGYTRQRLDINSVAFNTRNIKYGPTGVVIGQGVQANGVSQYRDEFLDLRYRLQAAKTGSEEVQLEALSDLENIMDEISMGKLNDQFSDLLAQLHSFTASPSDPVMEGVVRTSAQMLTQMLNNYSEQINTVRDQQFEYLRDGALVKVNQIMDNIARLNKQIRDDNISGNPALELNDDRNMLIDELSNYLDIEVVVTPESIGGGKTIDVLSIELKGSDDKSIPKKNIKLVDNDKYATLTMNDTITDKVALKLTDTEGKNFDDADFNLNIKGGQIEGYLKFLNGKGDFATSATDPFENAKGVLYFESMLDTLAQKFAEEMNKLNTETTDATEFDEKGNPKFDADGNIVGGKPKPLFEARDKSGKITAGNIKISDDWANATGSYITNTIKKPTGDSTGAVDNILRMISKFGSKETFETSASKPLFEGNFQEFLTYTISRLNLHKNDVQTSYDTYFESQYQLDYARSSMSSVDLNEEGVNLLQYSKSYNAAAKLMTTLDEMLDTLINRM